MTQITKILCPIDFSETSSRALDHAAALARWYEARLTVLFVYLNLPALGLPPPDMGRDEYERIMGEMSRFTARVSPDVQLDLRIAEAGDVHREILDQAGALQADLLVIGSHGRSGVERLLLGSVAEKVMRKAPCPLMVVPPHAPGAAPEQPVQFRHILCPYDFSESSSRALTYALDLAGEADARLTLLNVIEAPLELRENALGERLDVEAMRAAAEADRLQRLGALIPADATSYCSVETVVRDGAAYREILRTATENHADLIVMGVQGRGAVDLLVFGSNTARVARAAACPVLVVRP